MHWERLIDELGAAVDAEDRRELVAEVADRTRHETARLHVVDRLRAAAETQVTIGVDGWDPVRGRACRVGPDWLLVEAAAGPDVLLATPAILWIEALPPRAVDPAAVPAVDQRLGFRSVLRAVARDRRVVLVRLRDGTECRGVVARVGADFVDVGAAPRAGAAERCVPFTAIAAVLLT